MTGLHPAQVSALCWVAKGAQLAMPGAIERAATHLSEDAVREMIEVATSHGRVTISFHPDRLLSDGRPILAAMTDDGVVRSQFETHVSSGSVSAHAGGERDQWERELFGGAYQSAGVHGSHRPKYGALNLMGHPDGGSPRFGSCYLRLRPEVMQRCTFTFGDSYLRPAHRATSATFAVMIAALLDAVQETQRALGASCADTDTAHRLLRSRCTASPALPDGSANARCLDDYIEAQIHGELRIARDVEALIADPSFRASPLESVLQDFGERHGVPVLFHQGFELDIEDISTAFRGPQAAQWGARIGEHFGWSTLDAERIGRAAASMIREPQRWSEPDGLQLIKKLWHILVHFGTPAASSPQPP